MDSSDATLAILGVAMGIFLTFIITHLADDIQYTSNPSPVQLSLENSTISNIEHDCKISDYFYQSNHLDYCRAIGVHP